jgi:hypothetical protein
VGLVEHGRQLRDMLPIVPFAFLGCLAGILECVTQDLDLFAENVYDDVRRRLRASANVCLWLSAVICLRTSVGVFSLEVCGRVVRVCGRPQTSFDDVHVRRDTNKFRLVDEAVRGGAQLALVNQFVEGAAGNAELARRFGFGERGHGETLGFFEVVPCQAELVDCGMEGPDLEIFWPPIRERRTLARGGIAPLAMRAASAPAVFGAPEAAQFLCDLAVDHGTATA